MVYMWYMKNFGNSSYRCHISYETRYVYGHAQPWTCEPETALESLPLYETEVDFSRTT